MFLEILTWQCSGLRLSSICRYHPEWTLQQQSVDFRGHSVCGLACPGVQPGMCWASIPFPWVLADSSHVIQSSAPSLFSKGTSKNTHFNCTFICSLSRRTHLGIHMSLRQNTDFSMCLVPNEWCIIVTC